MFLYYYKQLYLMNPFQDGEEIMSKITKIWAREILDSRGNPTVEVDVTTEEK